MKRILVGLGDRTYSRSATAHAIELAQRHAAVVTAIGITDLVRPSSIGPLPIGVGTAARDLRQARYKLATEVVVQCVDEFAYECSQAAIQFGVTKQTGGALQALVEAARFHDLLICGLGGMFEHGVIQEPPEELRQIVESGVRPLLAVASEYRPIRRVLVAYSGSVESATAMRQFAMMNLWPAAQVRLVHFEPKSGSGPVLLTDARSYLSTHGMMAELEVVRDAPNDGLLNYAGGYDADLIVLGNSSKSLLRRRVFGETSLKAMASSTVPLFLGQ